MKIEIFAREVNTPANADKRIGYPKRYTFPCIMEILTTTIDVIKYNKRMSTYALLGTSLGIAISLRVLSNLIFLVEPFSLVFKK